MLTRIRIIDDAAKEPVMHRNPPIVRLRRADHDATTGDKDAIRFAQKMRWIFDMLDQVTREHIFE